MSDHKRRKIRAEPLAPGACVLCKSVDNDEFRFGKFYRYQNISVHYYCVLFACALPQNGRNRREGIEGFLTRDIIHESNRGARLRCFYCGHMGATVGCCLKKCKRVFHFPCGLRNGAQNQFFGQFCSYCEDHKSRQKIKESDFEDEVLCTVCYGAIEFEDRDSFLKAPCCASNCFHRECIQRYALSAGYFFKCTLCNDKSQFEKEMLHYGIHIPKQDASWEKERNAYQELLVRAKCDADECQCPKGRQENKESSLWHLVYCEDCGSTARHVGCEKLLKRNVEWRCSDCLEFTKKLTDKRKTEKKACPIIAQAGTSSSGSHRSRSKGESKQVRRLLKKCKSCVVKLKMLGYDDMPASVKRRYKHLLKDLKKAASINTKPSLAVKASKRNYVKKSRMENVEMPMRKGARTSNRISSTQNQYANLESTTCEIFTTPSRSSNAPGRASRSRSKERVKTNEVIDSCQKRVIKQTSIEGFLRNQVNGTVSGKISRSDLFLEESKRMQNKRKRDSSSNCVVKQISETITSTRVASTKDNSSVIRESSVLVKVTKTVNFYCKGIENFFQVSEHHSPEKTLRSLESGCESTFKQAMQEYISPQPSSSSGIYTSTDKNGITVNKAKQVRELVQEVQRLPSAFKKNRVSKVICSKNQIFKKVAIKTYSRSAKVTNTSISPSCRPLVYIDQRYIAGVNVVDKSVFDRGISSTLSIKLEDCLKPPSKALVNATNSCIPYFNGTYLNSDGAKKWGNCSFNNLTKQVPMRELPDPQNDSSHPTMTHQDLNSTAKIVTSSLIAKNPHDKTDCLEPKVDTKWPVVVKLSPDYFFDQVVHKQVGLPAVRVVWSKQRPLPLDPTKLCFPISPSNEGPLNRTIQPVLTIPRDIATNFTNALGKNRSSILPALCHQTTSTLESKNLMSTVSKTPPPMSALHQHIMSNVANSLGKIQGPPNSALQSICYPTKDALKAHSPIPTVPKVPPQVPMSVLHQRIMSNVANCLSKNQNRPNSTLAAICDQENGTSKGKNTSTEKYLHMSASGPKQTTNNEKRKKRLRFKSGNNDKRPLQSNTLFSYFCPL